MSETLEEVIDDILANYHPNRKYIEQLIKEKVEGLGFFVNKFCAAIIIRKDFKDGRIK